MSNHPDEGSPVIPTSRMRQLLHSGAVTALLADHFPVPTHYDGIWWYLPASNTTGYVPASPEQSTLFDRHAARLRLAQATILQDDTQRSISDGTDVTP